MKKTGCRMLSLLAALAAAVLAGAAVFASPAGEKEITIGLGQLAPGGKVSLGARHLPAGAICLPALSWEGGASLWAVCSTRDGERLEYPILKDGPGAGAFVIEEAGDYTVALRNCSGSAAKNLTGKLTFPRQAPAPDPAPSAPSLVLQGVQVYHPAAGEGGYSYLHEVATNNTGKRIAAYECGMLAFDQNGAPLSLDWFSLDSDYEPSYDYLYDWGGSGPAPGETDNEPGGWTLDIRGDDPEAKKVAYALYCYKTITFEDGSVWKNPDYQSWLTAWRGKRAEVQALQSYYPHIETIG